jgi:putative spermidine/putrescine transport system permease protein
MATAAKVDKTSRRGLGLILTAPLLFLVVFLVAPIIMLFRASFYEGAGTMGSGFSLEQYEKYLADTYYLSVLAETIGYGVAAAIISAIIGFPVGYSLARLPSKKRKWRLLLVVIPLTLSLVIVVFGWLVILGRNGLLNTAMSWLSLIDRPQRLLFNRGAVLLVLVQQFLPFMILSIMSVVSQIDPVLEQAAANLRADRLRTFRKVILPLAMPGIMSGATLVFILTVSAFITPKMIGGARVQMVGSQIYEQVLTVLNWPFAAAMSFILLSITFIVVIVANALFKLRLRSETQHAG